MWKFTNKYVPNNYTEKSVNFPVTVCFHRGFHNKYYHSMPNKVFRTGKLSLLIPFLYEPASQPNNDEWLVFS